MQIRNSFYPFSQTSSVGRTKMLYLLLMQKISKKHVIIAFPPTFISRVDKMSGIFRFVGRRNNWAIDLRQTELDAASLADVDGVLITGDIPEATRRILERTSVPTVFIAVDSARETNVASIATDPVDIGKRIADYFISRGIYEEFVIVRQNDATHFNALCAKTIRQCCRTVRLPCQIVRDFHPERHRKPLAVFVPNDYQAARVIADCQACGFSIPRDVAVLGFANDSVFCENNVPSISSVEPDFELQGFLAARELDRIMSARKSCPRKDFSVGLKQIVERASSVLPYAGKGLVRSGIAYIRRNATTNISVSDVIMHLKVSQRLAEMRFREITGHTILQTIHTIRLEATKTALLASDSTIAQVCEHCGWGSENGPKKLFRKAYGMSMRDFRKANKR